MTLIETPPRLGLVTGASGYVGGRLVGRLVERGWRVRVLTRHRDGLERADWADRLVPGDGPGGPGEVEVVEGDASDRDDLRRALHGVDVAWYLVHSMGDIDDFERAEREMAATFAEAAEAAGVDRIVYLGGLHPERGELSEHLRSRREVGRILLSSGVPTAALQAGVIIGDGSSSFTMLRALAERLPGVFGPRWLRNAITPIAIDDLLHFLERAADLPRAENRIFDVGGPETMPYAAMLDRAARAMGLGPRPALTIPVMTPDMASVWIAMVTSLPRSLVRPIVGSILHDTVVGERDLERLVGLPDGGLTPFDAAVESATRHHDPRRWRRTVATTTAAVASAAAIASLATDPRSRWYRSLRTPRFQPPAAAFPIAWTALYADLAAMCALTRTDLALAAADERRRGATEGGSAEARRRRFDAAFVANLTLNAVWSVVFFRGHRPWAVTGVAAALAASSVDLVRRVASSSPTRGALLAPYPAWTTFALALSGTIAALNRGRGRRRR